MKLILFHLCLFLSMQLAAQIVPAGGDSTQKKIINTEDTEWSIGPSENIAHYPGGEPLLRAFLTEVLVYPAEEKKNQIKGRVNVTFMIEPDGTTSNHVIAPSSSTNKALRQAALNAAKKLKGFKPAVDHGKAVRSELTIPIDFPMPPEDPFWFAQVMPVYPGTEHAMQDFISAHVVYPESAKTRKIEGKVYVEFIVEKDGTTSSHKVQRGIPNEPEMSAAALEAIKQLTGFSPAMQNGRPVRLVMTVPIAFSLNGKK